MRDPSTERRGANVRAETLVPSVQRARNRAEVNAWLATLSPEDRKLLEPAAREAVAPGRPGRDSIPTSEACLAPPANVTCPTCGSKMTRRASRFGFFYGCSRYPACRSTYPCLPDGNPRLA